MSFVLFYEERTLSDFPMVSSKNIAVYPGVFDPVTLGHMDIIARAAGLFDLLIVAVGESYAKKTHFSLEERKTLIEESLEGRTDYQNGRIKVFAFDGLLADFAQKNEAKVIIRGLRTVSDFDYEFQIVGINKKLAPDLETIFLPSDLNAQFISSGLVKEIAKGGGDLSLFVPKPVIRRFEGEKTETA